MTVIQEVQKRKVRRHFRQQKRVTMGEDKRWGTLTSYTHSIEREKRHLLFLVISCSESEGEMDIALRLMHASNY